MDFGTLRGLKLVWGFHFPFSATTHATRIAHKQHTVVAPTASTPHCLLFRRHNAAARGKQRGARTHKETGSHKWEAMDPGLLRNVADMVFVMQDPHADGESKQQAFDLFERFKNEQPDAPVKWDHDADTAE